jgi:WD40 repeat protein
VFTLKEHHDAIYKMIYDDKKDFLYSSSLDGTLRIWNDDNCIATLETGH